MTIAATSLRPRLLAASLAAGVLCLFAPLAATAQDAPPEALLQNPVAPTQQPLAAMQNAVAPTAAQAPAQTPATPPAATPSATPKTGGRNGDPCPAPDRAISSAPDDLAKVQEEIDRFTLCVQRAQLLERLNDSAVKSEGAYDAALGLAAPAPAAVPGLAGAQRAGGLPPLPDSALAGADVTPLATGAKGKDVPNAKTSGEGASTDAASDKDAEPVPEKPKAWTIRDISGSGQTMQARLLSPDGDEVKVREGMKLPDDSGVVVRITPSGVKTRKGNSSKSLDWAKD